MKSSPADPGPDEARPAIDLFAETRRVAQENARTRKRRPKKDRRKNPPTNMRDHIPWLRRTEHGTDYVDVALTEEMGVAVVGECLGEDSERGRLAEAVLGAIASEIEADRLGLRVWDVRAEVRPVEGANYLSGTGTHLARRTLNGTSLQRRSLPWKASIFKRPRTFPLRHGLLQVTAGCRFASRHRMHDVGLDKFAEPVPLIVGPSEPFETLEHLRSGGCLAIHFGRRLWMFRQVAGQFPAALGPSGQLSPTESPEPPTRSVPAERHEHTIEIDPQQLAELQERANGTREDQP